MIARGAACVEFRPRAIFVFFPRHEERNANAAARMLGEAGAESCCTLIEQSGEYVVSGIVV